MTCNSIPKDPDQRNIWLDLLDLPETTNGRVCSEHFEAKDYELKRDGTVWLRRFACLIQSDELDGIKDGTDNEVEFFDQFGDVDEVVAQDMTDNVLNEVRVDLNIIYKDYNYTKKLKSISLKRMKMSYNNRIVIMNIRRSLNRARSDIKQMKNDHKQQMKKFENFPKLPAFLQELVLILLKHHKKRSTPKQYSAELRKFAFSLQYYSPAGYEYVRSTLNQCLPHSKTIASWYKVVDGTPGFTMESLDALTDLQKRTSYQIVVSLVLDGMAIRKHLQRIGSRTIGYTECGGVLPEVDRKHQLAKEALIYLVVGVNVPFKLQVGYFLIDSLTGKQLAYVTETGVSLVQNCKIVVGSVTHDGLRSQLLMDTLLGCDFGDVKNIVTYFTVNGKKIFVFADMCHMIKLARNFVSDEFEFLDGKGRTVSWKYFVNLHKIQTSLGLHFANKVRNLRVNFRNQIMKVYLATQLFSSSVADAIEFLDKAVEFKLTKLSRWGEFDPNA